MQIFGCFIKKISEKIQKDLIILGLGTKNIHMGIRKNFYVTEQDLNIAIKLKEGVYRQSSDETSCKLQVNKFSF